MGRRGVLVPVLACSAKEEELLETVAGVKNNGSITLIYGAGRCQAQQPWLSCRLALALKKALLPDFSFLLFLFFSPILILNYTQNQMPP